MLKRKFLNNLISWKDSDKKKALLIKGARQIGKTYIVREFGKKYYKSFIELNLYSDKELAHVFDEALDMDTLKKNITSHIASANFIDGDTLLFIDEIEFAPNARTALKFIVEDGRYDCIATGSLLSINYKDVLSIPVGYEEQIEMHSLDFEEFLWAKGFEHLLDDVKVYFDKKEKVPYTMHNDLTKLLREYIVVGGMPEVVDNFVKNNDYNEVYRIQESIVRSNEDDIAKYATLREKPKVRDCYLSIPNQLAKENKKFMFSKIEKKATRSKYENSIEWLRDANVVKICYNLTIPEFPLKANINPEQFKLYVSDIGLLINMYGKEIRKAILDDTLKGNVKGGIYENLIADILTKKGEALIYYKNKSNTQEIEFFIERDAKIVPVEVKSGNNQTLSLNEIIKDNNISTAYKLINGNVGIENKKITLPHYMAVFI